MTFGEMIAESERNSVLFQKLVFASGLPADEIKRRIRGLPYSLESIVMHYLRYGDFPTPDIERAISEDLAWTSLRRLLPPKEQTK